MDAEPKILIAIPAYNHTAAIRDVASRALEIHPFVLVVDDGSSDGIEEALSGLDVRLIRHTENLGKGAAILTACREAGLLGMTHIVTIDADGQHDPCDFVRFVPLIRHNPRAVIVGNRIARQTHMPALSRFGRTFSNFWLRVQTGRTVRDVQCGFRSYPIAVIEGLRLKERRYSFEVEVLVKAAWAGVDLIDTEISVRYPDERISHFDLLRDNLRISLLNCRLTMRSVLPIPHRKLEFNNETGRTLSVLHPLRTIRALTTENISPAKLASAAALGVFMGALPLIGCHTIAIIFAAGYLRVNRLAALSASQFCMPPMVPALCIEAGYFMRHGEFLTEISFETIGRQGLERLLEWTMGSLLVGPILALLLGVGVFAAAWLLMKGNDGR